jgi:hypothetical protein
MFRRVGLSPSLCVGLRCHPVGGHVFMRNLMASYDKHGVRGICLCAVLGYLPLCDQDVAGFSV